MKALDEYLKYRYRVIDHFKFDQNESDVYHNPNYIIKNLRKCYWKIDTTTKIQYYNKIITWAYCRKEVWMNGEIPLYILPMEIKIKDGYVGVVGHECLAGGLKAENDTCIFIFKNNREVKPRGDNFKKFQGRCKCVLCESDFSRWKNAEELL